MSTWRFYIETYGCKVNQHESQLLREAWTSLGGRETESASEADIICINSCAITARAERDARHAAYTLKKLAPKARIILTGCAAQLYADAQISHGNRVAIEVDWLVPQREKANLLAGPWKQDGASTEQQIRTIQGFHRSRPVVKVQDGCRQNCSFCIVPSTRGKPRSRPFTEILQECRQLLESGYPELVISGINLRHYALSSGQGNFWNMLEALDSALAPEFGTSGRLRISSLEPSMLGNQALETIANSRMLAPHLHISLQHASPKILRRMGRMDTHPEKIMEFLDKLALLWPMTGLGADLLTGFPGEQEEDLAMLADFIRKIPLAYAHVFPFSPRPGTAAANFPEQLDQVEKNRRAALIRQIAQEKHQDFLKRQLGLEQFGIVLDQPDGSEGLMKGRNEYYAPCFMEKGEFARKIIYARPAGITQNGLLVEAAQ